MPEIEFVEVTPPAGEDPLAPQGPRDRARLLGSLVASTLALAGAALAVWAPFLTVGSLRVPADGFVTTSDSSNQSLTITGHLTTVLRIDGWGRTHGAGGGSFSFGSSGHDTRYGIVLAVVGGLFMLAALGFATAGFLTDTNWSRRATATARYLLLTAAAGAAAISGALYLEYLAFHDGFSGIQDGNGLHTAGGWCWIVTAIAAAVGVLTFLVSLLLARVAPDRGVLNDSDSQHPPNFPAYGAGIDPAGEQL